MKSPNNAIRGLMLAVVFTLLESSSTFAGILASVEKMVNPGSTAAPYDGFAANAFTTDLELNTGILADTWVSYALGVIPTAGTKITFLDVRIVEPLTSGSGFNQRYTFNDDTGLFDATPISTNVSSGDSHLIVGGSIHIVPPNENKFDIGSPPTASDTATRDYGVGTSMSGAWGFNAADRAPQTNGTPVKFAYLVLPRGSESKMQINVQVATLESNGNQGPGQDLTNRDFGGAFCAPGSCLIDVRSHFGSIFDDATVPSARTETQFGVVQQGAVKQQTYTIVNLSDAPLTLEQPNFSGPFSLVGSFPNSVAPQASVPFTVGLDSSTAGDFTGSVSFATNDTIRNPYNFALGANVKGTSIEVKGGGLLIPDNDATPALADGTYFGTVPKDSLQERTFTIHNIGQTPLTLQQPTFGGSFSLVGSFPSSVAPMSSVPFTVGLNTSVAGVANGSISFGNNDDLRNPYNFSLQGIVQGPGPPIPPGGPITAVTTRIGGVSGGEPFTAGESSGGATTNLNALVNGSDSQWVSYGLGVKLPAGEKVTALEVTLNSTGSSNGFHQRFAYDETAGGYTISTPSSANLSNGDSHLVVNGSLIFSAPSENRTGKTSDSATTTPGFNTPHLGETLDARNWGIGTTMAGAWGFTSADQAAQIDGQPVYFAYIVVPRGATLSNYLISVGVATRLPNGNASGGYMLRTSDFFPSAVIPEPGALTLLSLAIFGAIGSRRRRWL